MSRCVFSLLNDSIALQSGYTSSRYESTIFPTSLPVLNIISFLIFGQSDGWAKELISWLFSCVCFLISNAHAFLLVCFLDISIMFLQIACEHPLSIYQVIFLLLSCTCVLHTVFTNPLHVSSSSVSPVFCLSILFMETFDN